MGSIQCVKGSEFLTCGDISERQFERMAVLVVCVCYWLVTARDGTCDEDILSS